MVSITINEESAPAGIKVEVRTEEWDTKSGRVRGRTAEANEVNAVIDDIRSRIRRRYRDLCERKPVVTAKMVKDSFSG